jgi:hypothetical protein
LSRQKAEHVHLILYSMEMVKGLLALSMPVWAEWPTLYRCFIEILLHPIKVTFEPRHDKTNIVCASAQSDKDPCCSLTNSFTSRETDSEQHGS